MERTEKRRARLCWQIPEKSAKCEMQNAFFFFLSINIWISPRISYLPPSQGSISCPVFSLQKRDHDISLFRGCDQVVIKRQEQLCVCLPHLHTHHDYCNIRLSATHNPEPRTKTTAYQMMNSTGLFIEG